MSALDFGVPLRAKWTPRSAFHQVVYPALVSVDMLPRGYLVDAEGTSQDMRAGIDYIISGADGTQTTVASRVQWQTDYGTFTIRYRTERGTMSELTKRTRSILAGGTYPTITLQAYVSQPGGPLINAYTVRTEDMYRHIIRVAEDDPEHFTTCGCVGRKHWAPGGAEFLAVAITEEGKVRENTQSTLVACGVPIRSFRPINSGAGLWS